MLLNESSDKQRLVVRTSQLYITVGLQWHCSYMRTSIDRNYTIQTSVFSLTSRGCKPLSSWRMNPVRIVCERHVIIDQWSVGHIYSLRALCACTERVLHSTILVPRKTMSAESVNHAVSLTLNTTVVYIRSSSGIYLCTGCHCGARSRD